ncbi:RAP domain-containing, putative [Babesia ovis]|uniref:RAP domain-containing, putative n=1 Tax=Babesia ovis TaxID=5869 RepID=A0A9W5T9I3_BABOV|nr:RAP domain-containing, putative [Babesia ovis]
MIPMVSLSLRRCLYRNIQWVSNRLVVQTVYNSAVHSSPENVIYERTVVNTFPAGSNISTKRSWRFVSTPLSTGNPKRCFSTEKDTNNNIKEDERWMKKTDTTPEDRSNDSTNTTNITDGKFYFDADVENLSPEQQQQKEELIRELTKKLSGPLADENGEVPTGDDRPIAIEVDGPSHFYANSTKYTAYTKLKHRLLTRMGYKVLHVPYFEWRRLRGAKEREEYMREKLKEEPTEWIDPDDEAFYNKRMEALRRQSESVIDAIRPEEHSEGSRN